MEKPRYFLKICSIILLLLLAGCNLNFFPEPPSALTPVLPPTVTPVPTATSSAISIPVVTDTPLIEQRSPTNTAAPPTSTPVPPSSTPVPSTHTPAPPTLTPPDGIPGAHVGAGMGGLRLRQYPDTQQGAIMLTLKELTSLDVQGKTADNAWLLVKIPEGYIGWVAAQYVVGFDISAVPVVEPAPVTYVGPTAPPEAPAVSGNITGGAREIYLRGQNLGNRRNVFTTIGDSITDTPWFLRQFPVSYNLGQYGYLLPTLQYFMAVNDLPGTSFDHISMATKSGWSTLVILDPAYANTVQCLPGEIPVACEMRLRKASIVLIMIGTNDVPMSTADEYRPRLERIIEICIEYGVIPVLSTIPPRVDAPDKVVQYNEVIKATAQRYNIPLWDLYSALIGLPNQGLDGDGVHLSIPPNAPASTTEFTPENLLYGATMRNLTALQMLDTLLNQVMY